MITNKLMINLKNRRWLQKIIEILVINRQKIVDYLMGIFASICAWFDGLDHARINLMPQITPALIQ